MHHIRVPYRHLIPATMLLLQEMTDAEMLHFFEDTAGQEGISFEQFVELSEVKAASTLS